MSETLFEPCICGCLLDRRLFKTMGVQIHRLKPRVQITEHYLAEELLGKQIVAQPTFHLNN